MTKKQEGFSLIEVIIAVGILALISVYVLQVLVTSSRLNEKAEDLDNSVFKANQYIHLLDATNSIDDFLQHERMIFADVEEENGIKKAILYLDETWQPVEKSRADDGLTLEAAFRIQIFLEPQEILLSEGSQLVRLTLTSEKIGSYLLETEKNPLIYRISTTRYLP